MSSSAVDSLKRLPAEEQIKAGCAGIASALTSFKYAVVGGAACTLLGSSRITKDIDFVVLKGTVPGARKLLAADKGQFIVEPKTLHTYYKSTPPVEIEILAPPSMFKEDFDETTRTMTVNVGDHSVSILHPVLILNSKCGSILERANDDKKLSDARDIKYLLSYLANAKIFPTSQDLLNVSKDFVDWFVASYGGEDLWKSIKYNKTTGSFENA